MTSRRQTDLIKAWGLEAGFDRVGVARLTEASGGDSFTAWLERGDHSTLR